MLRFFVPSDNRNRDGSPRPLDGLNEIIATERLGGKVANAIKRRKCRAVDAVCLAAMAESGWKTPKGRCRVRLTFYETSRRRDPDNIFGGAKYILDGITAPKGRKTYGAGAIEDDSQRCIELEFGEIRVDKDNPGCMVEIEEEA